MTRIRLMIADDHTILVEAFRNLLSRDYDVVATASAGRSLLEKAPQFKPDVILLDIGMPLMPNCITHLLSLIPYRKAPREKIKLPKRKTKDSYDDKATLKGRHFVPEKF